jgi:hypothetical protein
MISDMPSLEFTALPLVGVEIRFHAHEPWFELDLAAAAKVQEFAAKRGANATIVQAREVMRGTGEFALPPIGQVVVRDVATAIGIVFQNDLFRVDWAMAPEGPAYPRFEKLRQTCLDGLALVQQLAGGPGLPTRVVNMTYLNFVQRIGAGLPQEMDFLAGHVRSVIPKNADDVHELQLRWREASGLDRALHVAQARTEYMGVQNSGYLLKTVTGKLVGEHDALHATLDACHDDLQDFFVAYTSAEARARWGQIHA